MQCYVFLAYAEDALRLDVGAIDQLADAWKWELA